MQAGHDDDPISAASSGLLALGVTPQRRLETLGLLSALLDLADERGEVLLDSALIETEDRLGIDACLEGYEWLERIDVIRRTWSGWVITNFHAHHGPAGMTAASMDVLRRHLSSADAPVAALPRRVPVEATAPVVTLPTWRRRLPAVAASVAAGVAVLAGATQFVPQAAVSGRNAAVQTQGSIAPAPANPVTAAVTQATAAATAPTTASLTTDAPVDAITTTTSTTLLPVLPCLSQTVNDLGSRSGLLAPKASVLPPGVLPCP